MSHLPKLNLIAAVCENMGIGHGGNLPWRLKSEMKYFSEKTTTTDEKGRKNAVVMGRKTWCSIPKKFRPLKDRINVVLSRDFSTLEGAHHVAQSFEDAITWLTSPPTCHTLDKIFIIGGGSIYKYALESKYPVRIYLTSILKSYECDAYFPRLSDTEFTLAKCQDVPSGIHEEDGVTYKIEVFVRKEEASN